MTIGAERAFVTRARTCLEEEGLAVGLEGWPRALGAACILEAVVGVLLDVAADHECHLALDIHDAALVPRLERVGRHQCCWWYVSGVSDRVSMWGGKRGGTRVRPGCPQQPVM